MQVRYYFNSFKPKDYLKSCTNVGYSYEKPVNRFVGTGSAEGLLW